MFKPEGEESADAAKRQGSVSSALKYSDECLGLEGLVIPSVDMTFLVQPSGLNLIPRSDPRDDAGEVLFVHKVRGASAGLAVPLAELSSAEIGNSLASECCRFSFKDPAG